MLSYIAKMNQQKTLLTSPGCSVDESRIIDDHDAVVTVAAVNIINSIRCIIEWRHRMKVSLDETQAEITVRFLFGLWYLWCLITLQQ